MGTEIQVGPTNQVILPLPTFPSPVLQKAELENQVVVSGA
jgi:hypothetical protein